MKDARSRGVRPLLLLEINEVPWRLVDKALSEQEHPALTRFFRAATTHTTVSEDVGELSPWVTWPSFHRGMTNAEHGIRNLGQDVRTFRGTPIWEEYRSIGLDIGICGSLQSWPPVDPGPNGFFVPDTFAHDEQCIPRWVEPLQRFNLRQVRKNGRVLSRGLPFAELAVLPALLRTRIPLRFWARVAEQIALERVDKTRVARRPTFQGMLYWEVFKRLFDPTKPPAFSTFFTNHVASAMHRYWDDVFPEDFPERTPAKNGVRPHAQTMKDALSVVDAIFADAFAFQRQCPDLIVAFASSMGQAAIHREHHGVELAVFDVRKLLTRLGIPESEFRPLLAMVPQVAVEVPSAARRTQIKTMLEACTTGAATQLFQVDETGSALSITIDAMAPRAAIDGGAFVTASGERLEWATAGIRAIETEPGTAYHIPEGVLAVVGEGIAASDRRTVIRAQDAKDYLKTLAGFPAPRPAFRAAARSGEARP